MNNTYQQDLQTAPDSLSSSIRKVLPGLLLVFTLGLAAYFLSRLHSSLDALFLALILGITTRNLIGAAPSLSPGVQLGTKIFIPVGIILYGTNLDFSKLYSLPIMTILLTLLCMVVFFILIYWLNRIWQLPVKLSELLTAGSAICGASAIAVLSPSVDAEPEDTSVSLLVITAAGLLGVMIYPILQEFLGLSNTAYAVLSGSTLHQTGLVRIAVSNMDIEFVDYGLAVKTLRIVMLAPIALIVGLLHSRQAGSNPSVIDSLRRVWFLLPFILVGLLVSFAPPLRGLLLSLKPWATFVFSMALASIGFMVEIDSVITVGSKPLIVGLLGWIGVVIFFLLISPFVL
jgi:uncharacterized integral membrane protein (TIGR00698 family)